MASAGRSSLTGPRVAGLRAVRGAGLLVLLSVLTGGCTATPAPSPSRPNTPGVTSPSPVGSTLAPRVRTGLCALLTDAEVARFAGGPPVSSAPVDADGLSWCRWAGADSATTVLATRGPAAQWAQSLLPMLRRVASPAPGETGSPYRDLARAAVDQVEGGVSDTGACAVFGLLAEVGGRPPGTRELLSTSGTPGAAANRKAEVCLGGVYAAVSLTPAVKGSNDPGPALLVLARRLAAAP